MTTLNVCGIPFRSVNFDEFVADTIESKDSGDSAGGAIRLSNAYCLALAESSSSYRGVLAGQGINVPDGTPVWLIMRLLANLAGLPEPDRVRGPSFFQACLEASSVKGPRHFFLGGTEESLREMIANIRSRYPQAVIAGYYAPPFGPVDETFMKNVLPRIEAAKPDIIWIGLGTPKQDHAAAILGPETRALCVGVGAAFDFLAGTVKEAPRWVQRAGAEWFFRLCADPMRLWKRYLVGNLQFLWAATKFFPDSLRSARQAKESQ